MCLHLLNITQSKNRFWVLEYLSIFPITFPIKNMYGLDGCELMGLDDELAIAFICNTPKQDTTNQHLHVILRVNINTMPTLHVVTLLLLQPQPRHHQTTPLTPPTPPSTTGDNEPPPCPLAAMSVTSSHERGQPFTSAHRV